MFQALTHARNTNCGVWTLIVTAYNYSTTMSSTLLKHEGISTTVTSNTFVYTAEVHSTNGREENQQEQANNDTRTHTADNRVRQCRSTQGTQLIQQKINKNLAFTDVSNIGAGCN
jgi:hypothetical protein